MILRLPRRHMPLRWQRGRRATCVRLYFLRLRPLLQQLLHKTVSVKLPLMYRLLQRR